MTSRSITPIVDRDPYDTRYRPAGTDTYGNAEQRIYAMLDDMRRRFADLEMTMGGIPVGGRASVSEADGRMVARVELPGFDDDDIDVTIAQGLLTIRAERTVDDDAKTGERRVRRHALFQHSLLLPNDIDTDRVEASLRNGVLTVTIPVQSTLAPDVKRIPVQRAEDRSTLAERYNADLSGFREKLKELRQDTAQFGGEVADGLKRRVEDLEGLGDWFAERLSELETAGEGAVAGLRQRLERAWHDMSQGLARLSERIRRNKDSS